MNLYRNLFWRPIWRIKTLFAKKGLEIGQVLPDFCLNDLSGKRYNLSDSFPRKGVLLWLTNLCSSCEEKIQFLEHLREQYEAKVAILAISTLGKDFEMPRRILQKHRFNFPLLLDPEDWVGRVLGFSHPEGACPLFNLLVLDRYGRVAFRAHLSAVKEEKIEKVIQLCYLDVESVSPIL